MLHQAYQQPEKGEVGVGWVTVVASNRQAAE
jgi:hypothetical protein